MLSEDFAHYIQAYGAFDPVEPVSRAEAESYRGKLPDSLLDLWVECGRGVWLGGRFQFCDPARYRSVLEPIFRNDPDFDPDECYPYGFTGFGELHVWSTRHQVVQIHFPAGWVSAEEMGAEDPFPDDLVIGTTTLTSLEGPAVDMLEDGRHPLFDRAVERLGRLGLGEAFGFVPALALGGRIALENVQRIGAVEHFSILAQCTPFVLRSFASWQPTTIRAIG